MLTSPKKQPEIGLWEAWIEFDHLTSNYFGMLYVLGEIEVGKKINHPFLLKADDYNDTSRELVLRINPDEISNGNHVQEILYSEPLRSIDQYTSVKVYSEEALIVNLEDIEVLV
jgi:hypothetical protein